MIWMIGRVVSTKLKNTATVLVERQKIHPLYKKGIKFSKKYLVDDSLGVETGAIVEIEKIRPKSRRKHFKIVRILGKNLEEITEAKLKMEAEEIIEQVMPEERSENSENSEKPEGQKASEAVETEQKAKKKEKK